MSSTPAAGSGDLTNVIGELRRLHDQGVDISSVNKAIDEIEANEKRAIETALDGVLDLAKRGAPKSRRFRLAYWYGKEAKVAEGIVYEGAEAKDLTAWHVYLRVGNYAISDRHASIPKLCEALENKKIPYRLQYID